MQQKICKYASKKGEICTINVKICTSSYRLKLISGLILAKKSSKYTFFVISHIFFSNEFTYFTVHFIHTSSQITI